MNRLSVLFDDSCNICTSSANYIKNNRFFYYLDIIPLSTALNHKHWDFDHNFSKDKLAVYDIEAHRAYYGVDAFIEILSYRYPSVKVLRSIKPVIWFLDIVYSLIAYNRKIIAPMPCDSSCEINPSKHYFYRVLLIIICGVFVHWQVSYFLINFLNEFYIGHPLYGYWLFFLGQILFQFLIFRILNQSNFYNYAGHVSFVSYLGALAIATLNIGLSVIKQIGLETQLLGSVGYGMVIGYMYYEHRRRLTIEQWSQWLSLSWFVYRLLIYPFAFRLI